MLGQESSDTWSDYRCNYSREVFPLCSYADEPVITHNNGKKCEPVTANAALKIFETTGHVALNSIFE